LRGSANHLNFLDPHNHTSSTSKNLQTKLRSAPIFWLALLSSTVLVNQHYNSLELHYIHILINCSKNLPSIRLYSIHSIHFAMFTSLASRFIYDGLHESSVSFALATLLTIPFTTLPMTLPLSLLLVLLLLLLVLYSAEEILMVWLIVYYPRSSSRAANRVRSELMIRFHQPAANPSGRYKVLSLPILSSSNFFLAIFE